MSDDDYPYTKDTEGVQSADTPEAYPYTTGQIINESDDGPTVEGVILELSNGDTMTLYDRGPDNETPNADALDEWQFGEKHVLDGE